MDYATLVVDATQHVLRLIAGIRREVEVEQQATADPVAQAGDATFTIPTPPPIPEWLLRAAAQGLERAAAQAAAAVAAAEAVAAPVQLPPPPAPAPAPAPAAEPAPYARQASQGAEHAAPVAAAAEVAADGVHHTRGVGVPGTCPICSSDAELFNSGVETGGEHFYKEACGHQFCAPCFEEWIKARVSDGNRIIPCPGQDCHFRLYLDDVTRLAPIPLGTKYRELLTTDYAGRLAEMDSEPGLKEWLDGNTQTCPECRVLVHRYEGCDYITCTCGNAFCYTCGTLYDLDGYCQCSR